MKRAIIILTLLTLMSPVYAGFTISADSVNPSICPTTTELLTVEITNQDNTYRTYTFGLSGEASSWTAIAPSGMTLAPNERGSAYLYVTPSMYAQTGNHNLKVTASSAGRTEHINFNVEVPECNGLSLSSINEERAVCSGTTGDFTLNLNNDGRWTETYDIMLSGEAAQWGSISKNSMTISSGNSEEFNVYVLPENEKYGDYLVTVTAQSRTTDAVVSKELTLTSEDCYDFDLSASENFASFCDNSEVKIPLTVENFGVEQNNFELTLNGKSWSTLSTDQFTIPARSSKTFDLILSPETGELGNYQFEVTAKSTNSDKQDSTKITTSVLSCRKSTMTASADSVELCPGDSDVVEIMLLNSGRFEETYAISASGISWAKLDNSLVNLESEESETVQLTITTEHSTAPGNYRSEIVANVQSIDGKELKSNLDIKVSNPNSCYSISADSKSSVDIGIGTGTLVPITLKNTGARSDNYQLTLTGDATQYAQINPGAISIEGNSEETVYLFVSLPRDAELGLYGLTLVAESDRSSVKVPINIIAKQGRVDKMLSNINEVTGQTTANIASGFNSVTATISNWIEKSADWIKNLVVSEDSHLVKYWYIFPIILLVMIISMFRFNNDSWMKDLELLEKELELKPRKKKNLIEILSERWKAHKKKQNKNKVITKTISKPKKKVVVKKTKKSQPSVYWQKFNSWLNEEIEVPTPKKKVKPKPKKKQKSLWNEIQLFVKSKPKSKKKKAKPKKKVVKPKKKKPNATWQKFIKWLDSEPIPKKKKVKPNQKKSKTKKKKKSLWQKFLDWLDEE